MLIEFFGLICTFVSSINDMYFKILKESQLKSFKGELHD